jgi:hypothetical protein
MGKGAYMAKQKNDVNTTGRNIRWATVIILLLIVIAGARWIMSSLTRAEDQQPLLEDIYLPKYRRIFEPFCIRIGGLGNTTTPLGIYSPEELMQWSEICIDGEKVDRDQLAITLSPDIPRYINFCFPDGLGDGPDWQYSVKWNFSLKTLGFMLLSRIHGYSVLRLTPMRLYRTESRDLLPFHHLSLSHWLT